MGDPYVQREHERALEDEEDERRQERERLERLREKAGEASGGRCPSCGYLRTTCSCGTTGRCGR